MKMRRLFVCLVCLSALGVRADLAAGVRKAHVSPIAPEPCHLDHLEDSVMAIVHFGLNTFVDKEWGYGDTPPSVFNPIRLDTDQWVEAMVAGEIRRVVLVTKHHDGFNLWPSPLNPGYTVADTPWKDGKGDLVAELRASCQKHGLRFGVYLSPWDRHQASYAKSEYVTYYHAQFDELFSKYGPLCEIWLDGANGGDGWYGGAREVRKLNVPAWTYYRMHEVLDKLHKAYPRAIAFGGEGLRSAVWPGNEDGIAPDPVWCVTPKGIWTTPECDMPLRPGWFWHEHEGPKSLATLVEAYFSSVGRGCVLNLGIAPNKEGRVGDDDVARLKEFGDYVRAFNAVDLAANAAVEREDRCVELRLPKPVVANCLDFGEDLSAGQKVRAWAVDAEAAGTWKTVAEGLSVGFRRMARFDAVTSGVYRVRITEGETEARLAKVAVRFAPKVKAVGAVRPAAVPLYGRGVYFSVDERAPANEVVFTFVDKMKISAFKYAPRFNNGVFVDKYEVYSSEDGKIWTKVKDGEFGNIRANPVDQWVRFDKPTLFRHLKIVGTHAVEGQPSFNRADERCILLY